MLTPQERRLQLLLRSLAAVFTLAIAGYLLPALGVFGHDTQVFSVNLPFVTNSVVKIGAFAVPAVLLWGDTAIPVQGLSMPITTVLYGSMIADGVILLLLISFSRSAARAGTGLVYLSPMQCRSLKALAEVVITADHPVVPPDEVARNVDRYPAAFRGHTKWIMKLVLSGMQVSPLLSLHPPLSSMHPDDRYAFLTRRFYQDVTARLAPPFWRMIVPGMIRMSRQLSFLGYSNDPRSFASVGYVRFTDRGRRGIALRCFPPLDAVSSLRDVQSHRQIVRT